MDGDFLLEIWLLRLPLILGWGLLVVIAICVWFDLRHEAQEHEAR